MIGATAWTHLRIPIKPASNSTLKLATGRLPDRPSEALLDCPGVTLLKSGGTSYSKGLVESRVAALFPNSEAYG